MPADPQVTAPQPAVDTHTTLIAQAKGALMLTYGIDSYEALAVLVHWARVTRTPVHTIAHTLMHGICEGNPQTEVRQAPLIQWLQTQLRDGGPRLTHLPITPVRSPTGP